MKSPQRVQHQTQEWNLFNPIPDYNYKRMAKNLDISQLENPNIQVIWEDTAENFTQERIKSVKQYFYKKYGSTNVNVITKVKTSDDSQQTVDVSVNIMDKNYQRELIKSLLESKSLGQYYDQVMNIDIAVENKMSAEEIEVTPFKRWYIKKIEFSNFLSYGENQVLDFDKCSGITVVESDPPNFGGKTVLTVDLLLFLFFNTTTKTQKAEEIFNRFTDKNKVSVKGDVVIDGEDYIIVRTIERRKAKKTEDWIVKTELDFFKKLPNGELQNFTGEQRRETENFIKNSIGTMDDFLMTILTTASNLEDLLEAKPTARGLVLSRFLGLEFLRSKEESAKEIYSEFSKSMMSNVYNTESLKQSNQEHQSEIESLSEEIQDSDKKIKDVDLRLQKGQDYKDNLLKSKFSDLDNDLVTLNPIKLKNEIDDYKTTIKQLEKNISDTKVIEPKEFYYENQHDAVKEVIKSRFAEQVICENKIDEIEELVKKYGDGIQCEHCGIKLMEAELTKKKISELEKWKKLVKDFKKEIEGYEKKEASFTQLKKDFDEYERNKLIKEKYQISLESNQIKLDQVEIKLKKYEDVQDKIKKNNEIDAQLVKANLRIDELISEKRGYERIQTSNQTQIENLKKRIENNNDIILKIAEEFEREKIYKIYLEVFGKNGISKIIMKTMMPLINQELQRLLMDSCYFNLEVRINDKNEVEFIMVDNSTGVEKLMTSGSGYEKTIAALALRAVITKVCSLPKPNIVAFDEVFGKISNENLDLVGEFFTKLKDYFEKIFVITHNPMVNNWANNVIRITKVDNVSKVHQ
jgi:DNA repair exonuclease SbcCD ATPase subunit